MVQLWAAMPDLMPQRSMRLRPVPQTAQAEDSQRAARLEEPQNAKQTLDTQGHNRLLAAGK
jgi:hypothetical protein